jgi:bifunctional UDP-N-acetylglucosamine pyrophosphorylase/glucosamine-1-phosphate N-acetyltransferase
MGSGPSDPPAPSPGAASRERRVAVLVSSGVVVEDPASTHVAEGVVVEPGARLRPFTILEGRTVVRAGASVGPFVRLVDVVVGSGAQILDHCLLRECEVSENASVGPFSHVRPGSHIDRDARLGNFVELKNTRLGAGSKASHLSYLGDTTVGPGVNIGAGTITCNYDGIAKHPTRIEGGAFVGSHSTLVAPVTVGAGAYVAAGSTVTEDVPGDALALGRSRQVVKPGWAARRRAASSSKPKD